MQNSVFRRLLNKITRSTFGKSVLMLAGGTAIAQVLNIATSPIISRLFSPDDFGVLSVYTSILSIVAVFATLRYEFAIPIAEDDKSAINVLALTLGSVGLISLVSLAIFSIFGDAIANLLNAQQLKPYFWLVSVGIMASGVYTSFRYWAFRKKNFKTITKTTVNQSVAHQAINLLWGFFIGGPIGLIVGMIVGRSAGIWTLSKDIRKDQTELLKSISLRETMRLAKRYVKFPLYSSWAAILNSLGLQLPVLLLSSMYGTEVTGSFGFANRIVALPMTFIGVAVGEVFFSEASSISLSNPERIMRLLMKLTGRLLLFGIVPFLVLAVFGPSLFGLAFGEAWRQAGLYASAISVSAFARLIVTPVSRVFMIYEKQVIDFILNAIRFLLVVILFFIASALQLSAFVTIFLYSVEMVAVYVLTFVMMRRLMKKVVSLSEKSNE